MAADSQLVIDQFPTIGLAVAPLVTEFGSPNESERV
jgi:hypothetical protein